MNTARLPETVTAETICAVALQIEAKDFAAKRKTFAQAESICTSEPVCKSTYLVGPVRVGGGGVESAPGEVVGGVVLVEERLVVALPGAVGAQRTWGQGMHDTSA